ncbi:hypothetical protein HMPREF9057_01409 [Actinomyces sp. oral taxon 171 str. F0337]|nr:hypothetical protein HMPREF9057_01409 [Actinomyces sp. oral taxon 171 str. F0337]
MHLVSHAVIVSLEASSLQRPGSLGEALTVFPPEAFSHPGEGYGRVRGVWDDDPSGPSGR